MSQGTRPGQEDFVLSDEKKGIFVLADGFGGPSPGAAASKTACEEVKRFLFKEAGDLDATMPFVLRSYFSLAGNVLFNALIFANRKVLKQNHGKNVHEKGGASVIAGFIDGDLLAIANVGTCSARLMRDGQLQELVIPRSYGRLVDPFLGEGSIDTPLMALGMADDLEPEIFEYRVRPGDWLMLFSDGVSGDFFDRAAMIQRKQLNPDETVSEVKSLFDSQDFKDNSSISLIIL
jgi:serine/threonine protein phosphatase PrpC